MERVDAAEKEASEVLHKLLSVERIEKPNFNLKDHNQVVVVVTTCAGPSAPSSTETQQQSGQEAQNGSGGMQWCGAPVTLHHSLFSTITGDDDETDYSESQVLWEGDAQQLAVHKRRSSSSSEQEQVDKLGDGGGEAVNTVKVVKRPKKYSHVRETGSEPNQLEDNVQQVRERLERCCECQEQNCFKGLNPESVYRHRLNIAELTKEEHDMYLMGVTMAVLTNPELTVRHKERRRLRSQYVFQGRRVCLDAFLYLENCTHYQLKRIRKHVMTRGVVPRVHGNHGKKPHNTFSLDIYRHTTMFLKHFIKSHTPTSSTPQAAAQSASSTQSTEKQKTVSKTPPLYLPPEVTRKTIHNAYREYCELFEPTIKVMGYSTFRHFMKEQFPHVKFCKIETAKPPGQPSAIGGSSKASADGGQGLKQHLEKDTGDSTEDSEGASQQKDEVSVKIEQIPVVFSDGSTVPPEKQTTFIVAPVSQIIQGPGIVTGTEAYPSYQLTTAPAECFSTQSDVETITVTPVIGTPLTATYSFTTL